VAFVACSTDSFLHATELQALHLHDPWCIYSTLLSRGSFRSRERIGSCKKF
jgi:hypothetical protein